MVGRGALTALVMVTTLGAFASTAAAQVGSEVRRFDTFVGKWRLDVDIKATPTTQALKVSGVEDCELFANMHVVCKTDAGVYRSMRTISYLAALKQYGSYTVDSYGYALYAPGQFSGNTWTFTSDIGGIKSRSIIKTSPDSYTATLEYAGADGKWVAVSTTKASKMK